MKIEYDSEGEKFMMDYCLELAIIYMKNSEYYLDITIKETEDLREIISNGIVNKI